MDTEGRQTISLGTGVIIFFVSLITLIAEFVLYMMVAMGTSPSGSGVARFFAWLMGVTLTTGVMGPIAAIVELRSRAPLAGPRLMMWSVGGVALVLAVLLMLKG